MSANHLPRKKGKTRIDCSVFGCSSNYARDLHLSFHKFPKQKRSVGVVNAFDAVEIIDQLKAWSIALRMELEDMKSGKICSLHFKEGDYKSFPMHHNVLTSSPKRILKSYAVPSQNLPESTIRRRGVSKDTRKKRNERYANRTKRKEESLIATEVTNINACSAPVDPANDVSETTPTDSYQVSADDFMEASASIKSELVLSDEFILSMEDMQREIKELKLELRGKNEEIEMLKSELEKFKSKVPNCDESVQVATIFDKCNITRNITNERELSTATGIENFNVFETIVLAVEKVYVESKSSSRSKMSLRDKIMMIFVKLKQNVTYSFLAMLFGCFTSKHCKTIFCEMLPVLSCCMKVAIPWPAKKEILRNIPVCFDQFKDVRVVVDCTEIFIQTPKNICCQILTYSSYKSSHTCKIMTGVTPAGNVSYISTYYGGRASDDKIFCQSNLISLLEPGDAIMVDKGFRIDEICARHGIRVIRPPFLKEKAQFSQEEAEMTRLIAKARVHVERSNQRIKAFKITGDTMPVTLIPFVEHIFTTICGVINLSAPIIGDDGFLQTRTT